MSGKRLYLAVLLFLATLTNAYSQDAANSSWTGPYIGLSGSIDAGTMINSVGTPYGFGGGKIGALAGYRVTAGNLMVGAEADVLFGMSALSTGSQSFKLGTVGTARMVIGKDYEQFLPYATFGLAYATTFASDTSVAWDITRSHFGLVAGVGIEFPLSDAISARVEARYMRFDTVDYGPYPNTVGAMPIGLVDRSIGFSMLAHL